MKKLALFSVFILFFANTSLAAIAVPQMSYPLNGLNIIIDWTTVQDATDYALDYAVYPYRAGDAIYSMEHWR